MRLPRRKRVYTVGAPEVRFWRKVKKTRSCWIWLGALNSDGYGNFRDASGNVLAHVFAHRVLLGPVPSGKELDHVCRVRRCIRPSKHHVEAVTHSLNMIRAYRFARKKEE